MRCAKMDDGKGNGCVKEARHNGRHRVRPLANCVEMPASEPAPAKVSSATKLESKGNLEFTYSELEKACADAAIAAATEIAQRFGYRVVTINGTMILTPPVEMPVSLPTLGILPDGEIKGVTVTIG